MGKLWLTDRAYGLWGSLFRIAYWLIAIYLSNIYLLHCSQQSWFKIGLMFISLLFIIGFVTLARILDHFFQK